MTVDVCSVQKEWSCFVGGFFVVAVLFFRIRQVVLDSYQWYSNSAPLCKRKAPPPHPTQEKREREERERWGKKKNKNREGEQGERDRTKEEHTVIKRWKRSSQSQ